ncbi:MAG: GldG family protein, partial [Betaproteobacteria bacterium]|nr:GldG family protein [Betaproteobacteria bacterium]
MLKKYESYLYSSAGVIAAFFILVLANFVLGAFSARVDLTQGGIYTLSEGTRGVLAKLESPVKIRLYFTQSADIPLGVKAFGRRVEDLLAEFRKASGGKITIEKFDPQPDSDAEDSAALDGVEAQVLPTGDRFYLGLAISILDKRVA